MADETAKTEGFSGRCLCGAVHYESTGAPQMVAQCHCLHCRKTSGTDHGTHLIVEQENFTLSGTLKFFDQSADSGSVVSRGFCPECGAPIYSTNSNRPGQVFVRASSLDDLEIAKPQLIVYASRAPSWRHLDPDITTYAEMPDRPVRPGA